MTFRRTTNLAFISIWLVVGCAHTITPDTVRSHEASAGAGLIAPSVNGGPAIITPEARTRYNGLIAMQAAFMKHGKAFPVSLAKDDGITPLPDGNYQITAGALEHFATMSSWFRAGWWKE